MTVLVLLPVLFIYYICCHYVLFMNEEMVMKYIEMLARIFVTVSWVTGMGVAACIKLLLLIPKGFLLKLDKRA